MSFTKQDRYPRLDRFWSETVEHLRKLAQAVNGVLVGETNNHFSITLEVDSVLTEISDPIFDSEKSVFFSSKSENAAVALCFLSTELTKGKLKIHHSSSSTTDRTYGVIVVG